MVWEDRGSIPGRVIPKTQKMVFDAVLLKNQYRKVWIKGKVEQTRERRVAPFPSLRWSSCWKGAFWSPSTTVVNFILHIYIYIYIYIIYIYYIYIYIYMKSAIEISLINTILTQIKKIENVFFLYNYICSPQSQAIISARSGPNERYAKVFFFFFFFFFFF